MIWTEDYTIITTLHNKVLQKTTLHMNETALQNKVY